MAWLHLPTSPSQLVIPASLAALFGFGVAGGTSKGALQGDMGSLRWDKMRWCLGRFHQQHPLYVPEAYYSFL
jgi:hypothetical protein